MACRENRLNSFKGPALASAFMLVLAGCIPGVVIGGVVCLVGCDAVIAHIDEEYGNGPEQAIVPENAHPIFVDSEVTTLAVKGGGLGDRGGEFDAGALAELDGFLAGYLAQGSGPLDVAVALGEGGRSSLVRETEARRRLGQSSTIAYIGLMQKNYRTYWKNQ